MAAKSGGPNEKAIAAGIGSAKEVREYIAEANNGSSPSFHINKEDYEVKGPDGKRLGAAGVAAMHYNARKSELGFASKNPIKSGKNEGRKRGNLPSGVKAWYVDVKKIYTSQEWDKKYGKPTY